MLKEIQQELKAPKNQKNSFGNYNYRSLEDILEAVKPILAKHNAYLTLLDTIENIGDRYYVKAVAKLWQDGKLVVENTAYAREPESKKGMDESQITGATSSYARKYCLNGLFAIDDTKDADAREEHKPESTKTKEEVIAKVKQTEKQLAEELGVPAPEKATDEQLSLIRTLSVKKGSKIGDICRAYKITRIQDMCWTDAKHCIDILNKKENV